MRLAMIEAGQPMDAAYLDERGSLTDGKYQRMRKWMMWALKPISSSLV